LPDQLNIDGREVKEFLEPFGRFIIEPIIQLFGRMMKLGREFNPIVVQAIHRLRGVFLD
jgi:hypothetical protein